MSNFLVQEMNLRTCWQESGRGCPACQQCVGPRGQSSADFVFQLRARIVHRFLHKGSV